LAVRLVDILSPILKAMNNNLKRFYPAFRIAFLSIAFILLATVFCDAKNIMDSDLSNMAGTNKNWRNAYWFFVNVSLLIVVCIGGYNKKYNKINRHYMPDEH